MFLIIPESTAALIKLEIEVFDIFYMQSLNFILRHCHTSVLW